VEDDPRGPASQESLQATDSLQADFDATEVLDYQDILLGEQGVAADSGSDKQDRAQAHLRDQDDSVRSERGNKVLDDYYERYAAYAGMAIEDLSFSCCS
jgi:hypothetical protein